MGYRHFQSFVEKITFIESTRAIVSPSMISFLHFVDGSFLAGGFPESVYSYLSDQTLIGFEICLAQPLLFSSA